MINLDASDGAVTRPGDEARRLSATGRPQDRRDGSGIRQETRFRSTLIDILIIYTDVSSRNPGTNYRIDKCSIVYYANG